MSFFKEVSLDSLCEVQSGFAFKSQNFNGEKKGYRLFAVGT